MESKEPTANISGTGGVTQSRKIFAPIPSTNDNGETSSQDKGNQVESNEQGKDYTQRATPVSEVEEFTCIIKKSDYKMVKQLNQTT